MVVGLVRMVGLHKAKTCAAKKGGGWLSQKEMNFDLFASSGSKLKKKGAQ